MAKKRGRNNSQKSVDFSTKGLGPAPKRIPNGISQSLSLKPTKNKALAVEQQLRKEAKQIKYVQVVHKAMLKDYVEKAIKEEHEEEQKLEDNMRWSEEKNEELRAKKLKAQEKKNRLLIKRQNERERKIAIKEEEEKKYRLECIQKEQQEIARLEQETEMKKVQEKHKERLRLKRDHELQEYIAHLKSQRQEVEEERRVSLERRIEIAERKFERIIKKKEHEQILMK